MMRLFFVFTLLLGLCLPISANVEGDDEQFLDGYDHSLQNYLTERFAGRQSNQDSPKGSVGKKWKIDDYVTVPKFGGYIVGKYEYSSGKGHTNEFSLRLLRLYVDGTVFKHFKYRVQMEVCGQPGGNGTGARVIDAYIDWTRFSWLGIKGGEFKRCFSFENPMNPWDISNGDYSQLTKHMTNLGSSALYPGNHNSGGRDLGIQLHGDLFKNSQTGHHYLSYQMGVYNGQGINVGDKDKEKDYIANVQVQPLKGWKIGVFGWHGSFTTQTGEVKNTTYFNRWAVGTSYESSRASLRAEYARNHNTTGLREVSDAWVLTAGYRVWRWLKPYVRYDALRTDAHSWQSLNSIYGVGLQARPHKNLQFQLQYNYIHNNALVADKDVHQIWTQAYIRF